MEKTSLGIYIHIPFCVQKCNYCDFLSFPADEGYRAFYIDCLLREIRMGLAADSLPAVQADTVFIGGGTPSLLSSRQTEQILQAVTDVFSLSSEAEITMECNPGTASEESLRGYRELGVNRLSIGVQSLHDSELNRLGRIHTAEEALNCYEAALKAGFSNLNIDLMSGIPGQTLTSYETTLRGVLALKPQHISAYSLIVEEGTPFYEKYAQIPPVDEYTDREMYRMTKALLAGEGYERYEISNYALEGSSCRHNIKYWTGGDYVGFGLGASSKLGNIRYRNESDPNLYSRTIHEGNLVRRQEEYLEKRDLMAEFFILGLRMTTGVSVMEFSDRFGVEAENIYGEVIARFRKEGLLEYRDGQVMFTEQGMDLSNYVLCEFL